MRLNNKRVTKEIKKEIKNYFDINKGEETSFHTLWVAAKSVLKGNSNTDPH